eukprot:CAMPEP_0180408132 /NCGR_PEP_ID=MMETSP0989-20121125/42106_1 /TAXON_ID=697907 /ORGANISM="non described non described, Strain CCMP2293" /LENGTH=351 /DNA_ID=CAMNT_0022412035 /DNA_START=183 /DNA_END=1235 /DNA_ORIENTATION=+
MSEMIAAATAEVKTLANCCKDSDNILNKINELHEKISGQGERERENELKRQCQRLRTMYERAKGLAEKESEACLECLAKIDQLIFSKTGESMPQPAVHVRKRPDLPQTNGAPPAKRQAVESHTPGGDHTPGMPRVKKESASATPKQSALEKQEAARRKQEEKERKTNAEDLLFEAAKTNNVEQANRAIGQGAHVNNAVQRGHSVPAAAGGRREHARGKGGLDSAHLGMLDELVAVVQALIDFKVDVEGPGAKDGSTPLGWCAYKDSLEVAKQLVDAGANVNAKGLKDGNTPLHWASMRNSCTVARLLLKHGASAGVTNLDGHLPATVPTAGREVLELLEGRDPGEALDPPR